MIERQQARSFQEGGRSAIKTTGCHQLRSAGSRQSESDDCRAKARKRRLCDRTSLRAGTPSLPVPILPIKGHLMGVLLVELRSEEHKHHEKQSRIERDTDHSKLALRSDAQGRVEEPNGHILYRVQGGASDIGTARQYVADRYHETAGDGAHY